MLINTTVFLIFLILFVRCFERYDFGNDLFRAFALHLIRIGKVYFRQSDFCKVGFC